MPRALSAPSSLPVPMAPRSPAIVTPSTLTAIARPSAPSNPTPRPSPCPLTSTASTPTIAEATESAQITSLPLRVKELNAQLVQIRDEAAKLDEAEAQIADLERTKKIQEGNFNYFATVQDQARIDEQLGPERFSNINEIGR